MSICEECPIRLFNTKHHNIQGVGNPFYGKCIVVPNVDYKAYKLGSMNFSNQVSIINSIISSTGGYNQAYIVPLLRCNEHISCDVDDATYNRCLKHFIDDICKYDFRHILLLGDAARRFLHCDITDNLNNICISRNNRTYAVNYSPFIKYVDDNKFNIFQQQLIKWYTSVENNDFTQYNILRI